MKYDPFYEGKIDRMRDEISAKHARIAELEAALRPFAAVAGVGAPRMKIDPALDRLWSCYDGRAEHQHEITRAHLNEAARVLKLQS